MGRPIARLLGIDPDPPPDPRVAEESSEKNAARASAAQAMQNRARRGRMSTILTDIRRQGNTTLGS